jgi:F0F1-type ATP synthase membrane subunit c/vacuolar-type H+-ATPase subunit K
MGVMKPDLIMKSIIPVVMAGVLGIYGLIIAVIIANGGARQQLAHSTVAMRRRATGGAPRICARQALAHARVCAPRPPPPRASGRLPRPRRRCHHLWCAISACAVTPPAGGVPQYSSFTGYAHLSAGLACGLSGLAAGIAIGIVGDAGVRAAAQQAKLFVGMVLILIFAEALGLYGLIVGLILTSKTAPCS